MIKIKSKLTLVISSLTLLFMISCNSAQKQAEEEIYEAMEIELDSAATKLVKFNNTLFSLPSPYQLAIMVKDNGLTYNSEILNPTSNLANYTNNFKKSLNLGIFGADLAYLNIYDQVPDAINYFSAIKVIAQDLGVTEAFDLNTIQSIERNMGNKDSLLYIISNTYRSADSYLKANDRNDVGVLVLAGGWIEGLHILLKIIENQDNQEIINRIGENKQPLENLIKILSPYYNQSDEFATLIDDFIDLAYDFDGITTDYVYAETEIIPEEKLAIINSQSKVNISEEQLQGIATKIDNIRNRIIK
jgi:hypothetical protein